jgi:hypothetical protein
MQVRVLSPPPLQISSHTSNVKYPRNMHERLNNATAIALVGLLWVSYLAPRSLAGSSHAMLQLSGKGWKGLVPLRATRRDVEAVIGPPMSGVGSLYQTNEATIFVQYTDGPCEKGWPYGWNVDKDTVVYLVVSPKEPIMFTDLTLDKNKYLQSRDSHISSRILFANHTDGITLEVDEITGKVRSVTYHPTASQQKLQCPDASSRLPVGYTQADPFFKFDVYGDVSPDVERQRLDAVAAEMLRRREADAYLIAYAGKLLTKVKLGHGQHAPEIT